MRQRRRFPAARSSGSHTGDTLHRPTLESGHFVVEVVAGTFLRPQTPELTVLDRVLRISSMFTVLPTPTTEQTDTAA